MESKDVCPQCGREYSRIGAHWSMSSECEYPPLSQKQREITTGLLMGDGNIDREKDYNPRLECGMISEGYLQYINGQFGTFGNGVRLKTTAKESAAQAKQRGFSPSACADNYSDVYRWRSINHPELQDFSDWYSTGEKVWPDDIQLTQTVLKHWYCGDGNFRNSGSCNHIRIAMANEVEHTDKIDEMFENVGLPSPNNYSICKRNGGDIDCNAQFTLDQSKELWNYMGEPLPDFEYKWPEEYR